LRFTSKAFWAGVKTMFFIFMELFLIANVNGVDYIAKFKPEFVGLLIRLKPLNLLYETNISWYRNFTGSSGYSV
nr:hypothetical protein [Flavobacteriales bacterium]